MAYDRTNTFTINQNDKDGVESRPDLKLDINIDGVRYFGSAWRKEGFYSGKVEIADDKYQPGETRAPAASNADQEIPF